MPFFSTVSCNVILRWSLPELRQQIRVAAWDQPQVTDASLLIILCADMKAWEKDPARYWASAPKEVQEYMTQMIDQYYRDREQVQRDEAMRSAGIAAQTIMLAAKSMGYDTAQWMALILMLLASL